MGEAEVHNLETLAHERSKLLDQVRSGKRLMLPENLLLQLFTIEWAQDVDVHQKTAFETDPSSIFNVPPFIQDSDQEELLEIATANMGGYEDEIEDTIAKDEIYTFMVENRESGSDKYDIEERVKMTRLRYTAQAVIQLSGALDEEHESTAIGVA